MWLFVLFIMIPLIEIGLFIQVGGFLGLWPTLGIVILTALVGTTLVRSQGLSAIADIQQNISSFKDPTESLAHGAMILAAGLLLLTPGFFTDAFGISLLLPPVRKVFYNWARSRIHVQHMTGASRPTPDHPAQGDTIDAEYVEIDESDQQPPNGRPSKWTRD